jgi:phosphoglycerol transferase
VLRGPLGRDVLAAVAAAVLALVGAAVVLQLWDADLAVPFSHRADATDNLMLIKGIIEHGWWFSNPNLGAPTGQDLHDFAVGGDNLHLLIIRLLAFAFSDPAVVMNLFFLLSFPLAALSAFAVLRWMRVSRSVSVAVAVIFAMAPYAFLRGEPHLFFAADYAVPLGCWLALAVLGGHNLWSRRADSPDRTGLSPWGPRLVVLGACVAVASTGTFYFAAFTLVLVTAAVLLRLLNGGGRRALGDGGLVVVVILIVAAVNLAPTAVYALEHGRNAQVARRGPADSERYGLKLAQLALPVADHRLAPLADLKARYAKTSASPTPNEALGATLGAIGTVGLAWLLFVALAAVAGTVRWLPDRRHRHLAALVAVALVTAATGGLATIFAYVGSNQLRAWNRISIFIAFLCLAAVALLLERGRRAVPRAPSWAVAAGLAVVVALGVLDQTTESFAPDYRSRAAEYHSDAAFIREVEGGLPRGASVLELPYIPFPEGRGRGAMLDYDLGRGYIHSRHLRFSYGAMKGRSADWQAAFARSPLGELLAAARRRGFSGVYVDRYGYSDRGRRVERALRRIVHTRAIVSPNRRLAFYPMPAGG